MRPPSTPRFHKLRRGLRTPHVVVREFLDEYGDLVCWRGFVDLYFANHPDFIRPILSQGHEHFSKRNVDYRVLAVVMGNGLITNDGPHWVRQRALMQPMFSHRNVNGFDETINRLTSSLMHRWDARAGDEGSILTALRPAIPIVICRSGRDRGPASAPAWQCSKPSW